MKKLLIFFLFSFISISSNAQYGDKEQEVDNLAHLAKVWGFLKYHHPAIKECTIDWDGALLHSLSKLYGAPQSDYPAIVEQLIDTAGVFVGQTGDKPILIDDEELNNLDVTWFQSSHLTPAIQAKLEQIYEESRESEHCLLASVVYDGTLRIEAEKSYDELGQYPSRDHRVLAVFTYWNIIEYFFPYKHIMDQDWDTTLEQFATSIAYAEDALDYHLRFGEFTSYINDTHGFFTSTTFSEEWLGSERAPFRARYIEGKTVITRVHESVTRLEVGDIILGIDGQPIEERLDTLKKYLFGSNEAALLRVAHFFLPNGQAGNFDITVQIPNGTIFTATDLYRSSEEFQFQDEDDPAWKKIVSSECGEVGYIDMGTFKGIDMPTVVSDLWEKKGLIIDLRLYPNTSIDILLRHLFNEPVHHAITVNRNPLYAGQFYREDAQRGLVNSNKPYEGTIVILFDERTISQGEYAVMALEQYANVIKVGSPTSGADGDVRLVFLPGQIDARFSSIGIYYPDGTPTQRVGLIPDIEVKPTIEGIIRGRDEVLDVAKDYCTLVDMITSTSVEEQGISIAPNPVSSTVSIDNKSGKEIVIQVLDLFGKHLLEKRINGSSTIDVSHLSAGLYILSGKVGNQYFEQKIVKL